MMEMDGSSDHKGAKDPVYALAMIDTQTQNRALMEAEEIFNEVTELYQKYNLDSEYQ